MSKSVKRTKVITQSEGAGNRAVTYARVSGDDRGRDGRNLAGQGEMTREYCEGRAYKVTAELSEDDRGASGAAFELPQLGRVLEMARAREFDVLVVREIDRLSRNLAKQLVVESELKQSGVRIEYVLGEYPDTPEGNFMKHVRASVAEFEREKIRERMLRGRFLKAKSGKWVGHCQPFGYKRIGSGRDAILAVDEQEAKVVSQVFKWFVTESVTLREIASRLTKAQVPIPGTDYNKPGTVWSSTTIRRMLRNTSYAGRFHYAGYEINLLELAIVSEDDFAQVQEKLNSNKSWRQRGPRATPGRYLLLGHFFCLCGYRMTGKTMHKDARYVYYGCVTSSYPKEKNPCKERIRQHVADEIVWEWLTGLMSMDERRLRKGLTQMAAERESRSQTKRDRLKVIEAEIKLAEKKIAGLMRTFEGDDDETVVATLREQVNAQKKLKADLTAQRDRLADELSQNAITEEQIESIIAFARRVKGKMDNATHENKRELIELLNVRVDLVADGDARRLEMSCDLPGSNYASFIRQTNTSPRRNTALPSSPSSSSATRTDGRSWLPASRPI